jgi:hypothetical protein
MTNNDAQRAIDLLKNGDSLRTSYADYGGIQIGYNADTGKIIFDRRYWSDGAAQYEHREMSESEFEAYMGAAYSDWDDFAAAFGV